MAPQTKMRHFGIFFPHFLTWFISLSLLKLLSSLSSHHSHFLVILCSHLFPICFWTNSYGSWWTDICHGHEYLICRGITLLYPLRCCIISPDKYKTESCVYRKCLLRHKAFPSHTWMYTQYVSLPLFISEFLSFRSVFPVFACSRVKTWGPGTTVAFIYVLSLRLVPDAFFFLCFSSKETQAQGTATHAYICACMRSHLG